MKCKDDGSKTSALTALGRSHELQEQLFLAPAFACSPAFGTTFSTAFSTSSYIIHRSHA